MTTNMICLLVGIGIGLALVIIAIVTRTETGGAIAGVIPKIGAIIPSIGSRRLLTGLLIIAGAIILYCGIYSQKWETPSMANAGSWSWDHWLWILVLAGILAILIARTAGGMANILNGFLVVAMLMIFIVAPIGGCIANYGEHGKKSAEATCPDASANEMRTCMVNDKDWSHPILPAGGTPNGMYLCYSPRAMVLCNSEVMDGTSIYRFKAREGKVEVKYWLAWINQCESL
jgi:hypothetical protein